MIQVPSEPGTLGKARNSRQINKKTDVRCNETMQRTEKKRGYEENWLLPEGAHLQAQCNEEALEEESI